MTKKIGLPRLLVPAMMSIALMLSASTAGNAIQMFELGERYQFNDGWIGCDTLPQLNEIIRLQNTLGPNERNRHPLFRTFNGIGKPKCALVNGILLFEKYIGTRWLNNIGEQHILQVRIDNFLYPNLGSATNIRAPKIYYILFDYPIYDHGPGIAL